MWVFRRAEHSLTESALFSFQAESTQRALRVETCLRCIAIDCTTLTITILRVYTFYMNAFILTQLPIYISTSPHLTGCGTVILLQSPLYQHNFRLPPALKQRCSRPLFQ